VLEHLENNLSKFGYILDMKVNKKKKDSFYILGYILEFMIFFYNGNLEKFFLKNLWNLANLGHFFDEKNPLYMFQIIIFHAKKYCKKPFVYIWNHVFHVKKYCKDLLTKNKNQCYKINQGLKCGEICTMVVMGKRKNLSSSSLLLLLFGA